MSTDKHTKDATMDGHTRNEVQKRLDAIRTLKAEIDWLLVDQPVEIVSKYNGQPWGRSRKPLTGEIRRVTSTHLDEYQGPRIVLFIEGERVSIAMDAVRFKDERAAEEAA